MRLMLQLATKLKFKKKNKGLMMMWLNPKVTRMKKRKRIGIKSWKKKINRKVHTRRDFWSVFLFFRFQNSIHHTATWHTVCQDRKPLLPEPSVLASAATENFQALASTVDTNEDLLKVIASDSKHTYIYIIYIGFSKFLFWISNKSHL